MARIQLLTNTYYGLTANTVRTASEPELLNAIHRELRIIKGCVVFFTVISIASSALAFLVTLANATK